MTDLQYEETVPVYDLTQWESMPWHDRLRGDVEFFFLYPLLHLLIPLLSSDDKEYLRGRYRAHYMESCRGY